MTRWSRPPHVEVFPGARGSSTPGFYCRVVGGNGEIMAASESYTRRANAVRAARRLYPGVKVEVYGRTGLARIVET